MLVSGLRQKRGRLLSSRMTGNGGLSRPLGTPMTRPHNGPTTAQKGFKQNQAAGNRPH
jgi:hypothetical protein